MNKRLHYYALVIIIFVSTLAMIRTGLSLLETDKINTFISSPLAPYDEIPKHQKAQFAQAYSEAQQGSLHKALERLIAVTNTKDKKLKSTAYFNRGNIYLHMAETLGEDDARRASITLAKQDYRQSLLIDASNQKARFNLELALLMLPEKNISKAALKRVITQSKAVRVTGFRVDLP